MSARELLVVAFVVLAIAAGAWYWSERLPAVEESVPMPAAPVAEEAPPEGPLHPLPEVELPARPEVIPLPPLDESDDYLRLELAGVFGDPAAALTARESLIDRLVATIDALPRPQLPGRIRPVAALEAPFIADGQDGAAEYQLGAANFSRYDVLVEQFAGADLDATVDLYRRYYPLLQQAYERLGYPDGYFNDRLVNVIDHLLATPEVDGILTLVRPHVLYEYADPALEALSSGQKLLLRIGPTNRARVKARLREIRTRIASN